MACDCAVKAGKDGYKAIALGNWEECHADKALPGKNALDSPSDKQCFNAHYQNCKSGENCFGELDYLYIYAFSGMSFLYKSPSNSSLFIKSCDDVTIYLWKFKFYTNVINNVLLLSYRISYLLLCDLVLYQNL